MPLTDVLAVAALGLENGELLATALFGGGGLVALGWGAISFRDGYEMWSNDPVEAAAVAEQRGVVEVTGTARPLEDTVVAPYTDTECLAHEHRTRVKEDGVGDDDNDRWRTVDRGEDSVPFLVEDDSGTVAVDPEGADLSMDEESLNSNNRRRKTERRLDVGETVHVFGHRRDDGDGALADEPVHIGDGDEANYRIADASGERAVVRLLAKGTGAVAAGAVFVGVAGWILSGA